MCRVFKDYTVFASESKGSLKIEKHGSDSAQAKILSKSEAYIGE